MFDFLTISAIKKKKKKKSHCGGGGGESNPFVYYVSISGTVAKITIAENEYYCIIVCIILYKIY